MAFSLYCIAYLKVTRSTSSKFSLQEKIYVTMWWWMFKTRLTTVIISWHTQMSNHYLAYLQLIYISIIFHIVFCMSIFSCFVSHIIAKKFCCYHHYLISSPVNSVPQVMFCWSGSIYGMGRPFSVDHSTEWASRAKGWLLHLCSHTLSQTQLMWNGAQVFRLFKKPRLEKNYYSQLHLHLARPSPPTLLLVQAYPCWTCIRVSWFTISFQFSI